MTHGTKKLVGALVAVTVGLASTAIVASPAGATGQPARIKGVVVAPDKAPLPGIHVSTLRWNEDLDLWSTADSDTTGPDGSYSVGKLVTGTYRVRYYDPSGTLATEFYNNVTRAADAEPIDVSKGNFTLEPVELGGAAHLTGLVTGSDGAGIAGAEVTAYVQQDGNWISFQSVVAGADGRYDLGGLPGGGYTLGFKDPVSGVSEYWNDQAALVDAATIQLSSSGTSDQLDAQLATPVAPTTDTGTTTSTTGTSTTTDTNTTSDTTSTTDTSTTSDTTSTTGTGTTTSTTGTSTTTASKVSVVKKPRIKGFKKVGQRLRVTKGAFNPTTVSKKFQWLANGKKIKGATKRRLRLTAKMAGKRIRVKVTVSAPGMQPVVVKTARTKRIKR